MNIDKREETSHEKSLRMVVNNRLFYILSIIFLITGIILSAVGITLIIISSTQKCTPVESEATVPTSTPDSPIVTQGPTDPSVCPTPICQATMFGTQVNLAQTVEWKDALKNPESPDFIALADAVSQSIINALEGSNNKKMILAISEVTYEVQVNQFTKSENGNVIAYTSGVAMSTGPVADLPKIDQIRDNLNDNLEEGTTANVDGNELSFCADIPPPVDSTPSTPDCPVCTSTICPLVETTECPSIISTECPVIPSTDCPLCPTTTECPSVISTDCPTISHTDCPLLPTTVCPICPVVETTECPDCSSTVCPIIKPTDCPLIPTTECPTCTLEVTTECPSMVQTECPLNPSTDCPTCSTECPSIIPTECPLNPSTDCPTCPFVTVIPTECPSIIPTDCPLNPSTDCSTCPSATIIPTNCPSITPTECPLNPSTECPTCPLVTVIPTDCPSVISTDCPHNDCTNCPSEGISTDCPSTTCPIFSCTDCPKDCPSTDCSPSTDSPSLTCPTVIPTDCPKEDCSSTECPISTECPTVTSSTDQSCQCPAQTCQANMFGTRVSLDQTQAKWDPQLGMTGSQEFNDTAAIVSQMIINALEESSSGMLILASSDVTYEVKVNQFTEGENEGTIAYTSGVVMSTGFIGDLPNVYDIQKKLDSNLKDATSIVDDNELDFCPYLSPSPSNTTPCPQGTTQYDHTTVPTTTPTVPEVHSTTPERDTTDVTTVQDTTTKEGDEYTMESSTSNLLTTTNVDKTSQSPATVSLLTTTEEAEIRSTQPSTLHTQTTQHEEGTSKSYSIPYTTNQEEDTTQAFTTVTDEDKTTQSTTGDIQSTTVDLFTPESDVSTSSIEPVHYSSTQQVYIQSTTIVSDISTTQGDNTMSSVASSSLPDENTTTNDLITAQSDETMGTEVTSSSSQHPPIHSTTENVLTTVIDSSTSSFSLIPDIDTTTNDRVVEETTPFNEQSTITDSHEFTTQSSPSLTDGSTIHESRTTRVSTTNSDTTEDTSVTTQSIPIQSTTQSIDESPSPSIETSKWTNEPTVSSTQSDTHSSIPSSPSTEFPIESTTVLQQMTTKKTMETTVEESTTILSTIIPSTSTEMIPTTAVCTGREVINGDVFLLFDYTGDTTPDEGTLGVENFITETLFSFVGNNFFFGIDSGSVKSPLNLFLVHYPTKTTDEYTQFVTKSITSLDQLTSTIRNLINKAPPASTESRMKDALNAIYTTSTISNPPSIILISKSGDFVDESIDISTKLQTEKKFSIIGVPLNFVDLTPLTNYNALPIDLDSADSQIQTATEINDILMSLGKSCVDAIPSIATTTTPRYTTPSTTPNVPTTLFYCETGLKEQSIAFIYQLNYQKEQNIDIISSLLASDEVEESGTSAYTALFPYPNTDTEYAGSSAHTWTQLNSPMLPIMLTGVLHAPQGETGTNITDGIQSLIDNPDDKPGPTNNIIVIIANSASGEDVTEASELIESSSLKDSSTIITLSYGETIVDLSSLASSNQYSLTQTKEDAPQAASLLLNSLLQAACQ